MIVSQTGAPANYAELYEHYFPSMRAWVARAGIHPDEVEDVAMDLLAKFMEKDALSWYDPNKLFDVGENPKKPGARMRPARFSGLLKSFVMIYVRSYLDKQRIRDRREPQSAKLDAPSLESEFVTWGEVNANQLGHVVDFEIGPQIRSGVQSFYHGVRLRESEAGELLAQGNAVAEDADTSMQRQAYEMRKEAHRQARDAQRCRTAFLVAVELAEDGVRVSGPAVARHMGWSENVGAASLRDVRASLKAVGL